MTRIDFADGTHNYFTYDADSKRVSKQDSDGFTEFVYQGPDMLKLLLERDEAGETQTHYTMGGGLEAMRRGDVSSFYHYNHLGTMHELTDADQVVTDTYRHNAWGVPLSRTGSTLNPHTYVGRERYYRMAQAGLYHLGFRDYAQRLGRFVARDPIYPQMDYNYVKRPSRWTDPSGLWGCDPRECQKRNRVWSTSRKPHTVAYPAVCPSGIPGTMYETYITWYRIGSIWACVPDPDSLLACLGKQACRQVNLVVTPHTERPPHNWYCVIDPEAVEPVPIEDWTEMCFQDCMQTCEIWGGTIICGLICVVVVGLTGPGAVVCHVACELTGGFIGCSEFCSRFCSD